jgi:hypothetical protein
MLPDATSLCHDIDTAPKAEVLTGWHLGLRPGSRAARRVTGTQD